MNARNWLCGIGLTALLVADVFAGSQTERIRNDKLRVVEESLGPGEASSLPGDRPSVLIYLDDGSLETGAGQKEVVPTPVKRGDVVFRPSPAGTVKNTGSKELRLAWIQFLGKGNSEMWGDTGLAPGYRVLVENQYARVYDIRFAAGTSEPLHTHHDRVVVCLSGAELEHELPDGRRETSSLKTGEITWRKAATHVGHNLGKTDLWVIAIEPK
jgi:hypothetical protein